MSVEDISYIFSNNCNYNNIKKNSSVKMRDIKNGIKLLDALSYRYIYAFKNITKVMSASTLNYRNNEEFDRQTYDSKEGNIPTFVYSDIFNDLCYNYNNNYVDSETVVLGIDGTYNRDVNFDEILNMGLYDITNSIPVGLESFGKNHKNDEKQVIIDIISRDPSKFSSAILVADRAYYSYDVLKYLIDNDIKFIIRIREDAIFLNGKLDHPKNKSNSSAIYLRDKIRIISCNAIREKIIYPRDPNKKYKRNVKKTNKMTLTIRDNCHLITNLLDEELYDDATCLKLYKSRWDIEVFFRFIKHTYKFSKLTEKKKNAKLKSYFCILAIEMVIKIIIKKYLLSQQKTMTNCKFNHSNIVKGITDFFLMDLISGNVSHDDFLRFCKSYIHFVKIKNDRKYPHISKMPFSKWYVKQYSDNANLIKIVNAIKNNCLDKLNKNEKAEANRILKIDGVDCADFIT